MLAGKTDAVGQQLEQLWTSGTLTGLGDAELLGRFAEARARDGAAESAFRELIDRHGPMVMGVCRQILRRPHDADDAFQATFLVLVRKARSIRVGDSLAPWLYGVAYRTAHRARSIASRYRSADVEPMEEPMGPSRDEVFDFDLRPLLHDELSRLPGKYRDPIVLCHLEGKSHEEAARLLQWPVGTVSGRLSRGRQILKSRLERRGVAVSPLMLSANWLAGNSAVVATPLIESTMNAAFRFGAATAVSGSVLALTQGVLKTMLLNKIKMTALVVLVAGGATAGVGAWAYRASGSASPPAQENQPAPKSVSEKIRSLDREFLSSHYVQDDAKNFPNLNPRGNPMPVFSLGSVIVAESPDRSVLLAMRREVDQPWQRLPIPPGTTAYPIASTDTLALRVKGKVIDQIAAFSGNTGEWAVQRLLKPIQGEISPALGRGCALYQVENDFYAFGAICGKWGVLRLEGREKAKAEIADTYIKVLQGNKLYIFSVKYGEWSQGVAVNLRPFQLDPQRTAPAK